jgi:hypothetical protein
MSKIAAPLALLFNCKVLVAVRCRATSRAPEAPGPNNKAPDVFMVMRGTESLVSPEPHVCTPPVDWSKACPPGFNPSFDSAIPAFDARLLLLMLPFAHVVIAVKLAFIWLETIVVLGVKLYGTDSDDA